MSRHRLLISTTQLICQLNLQQHPEGGYFAETDRQTQEISSPYANGEFRSLATSIFYLLTYEQRNGVFHMNKSITQHVLHDGRAQYTLITPGVSGVPPRIETVILGTNTAAGERRQLIVGSGIWKMSAIPKEDILSATTPEERENVGCLITEVVFPGFHWKDHAFLTKQGLEGIFVDVEGGDEKVKLYQAYLRDTRAFGVRQS